ncbi:hypothetical protein AWB71_04750 [Caballeronia peredens]|nr:hypothetical protein AWB71_04750 [Caballeronia peredens]
MSYFTEPALVLLIALDNAEFVAYSCEPFTASVDVDDRRPAPTLVIVRSLFALPTDTVPVAAEPANVYAVPPIVTPVVFATAAVDELVPNATELATDAFAF